MINLPNNPATATLTRKISDWQKHSGTLFRCPVQFSWLHEVSHFLTAIPVRRSELGVDGTSIRDKSKCLVLLGKNETGFA
jgi:hypothetical protein